MPSQQPDYYALLDVDRGVSAAELDRAYRRAARATHPDIHPNDASAAERFHAVTIAYETLSDPRRRASYDRVAAAHDPAAVPTVRLGRPHAAPEPLRPFLTSPRVPTPARDLFALFEALARLVGGS